MAEWLRRWIVAPTTRVQFSPVTPFEEGGSVSGKPPVFEAGFGRSIRSPPATGRLRHGRRGVPLLGVPLNAEVPGSRPGRPASCLAGIVQRKGQNATNVQIGVRLLIPVPDLSAGRPICTGHSRIGFESPAESVGIASGSAPNAEIGVGIPTGRPCAV